MKSYLGIELGSTRIKAVAIDDSFTPISSGDYVWVSRLQNGIWTYDIDLVWDGIKSALSGITDRENISVMGVSGMMHGYLAFDKDWNLLVPFRTWQNTVTAKASEELTRLFNFNIPQRWSIAHLYQAILNKEPHVEKIAHITTLAGYVHYMLTGVNAIGIGEASGMFPIDSHTLTYNEEMLKIFEDLTREKPWNIRDILPTVLVAGENAGSLTEEGAKRIGNLLKKGIPFVPAEGDAGTGMTATNAISPRTGNVSAGTSIFSMVVLEKPLSCVYPEIDIVTTPTGRDVAMVHCNNCTNDMNVWVKLLNETLELFGCKISANELFTKLYQKSLEGAADCDNVIVYNYMAGEGITHLDSGRPLVIRKPESNLNLANFIRSQLYSTMATLRIGMDIISKEDVKLNRLMGHGGLFKTPVVGQKYLAAAFNTPVTCMSTAGEGGAYGMALLASYFDNTDLTLDDFLNQNVFAGGKAVTVTPEQEDTDGFNRFISSYRLGLEIERKATERF